MALSTSAIKGRLLYFLLTDDYGVGESQCKIERLIQCAQIPRHEQRNAKEAIEEMLSSKEVPLYSKGGGARQVVQINPSQLERVKELANEWHDAREPGESFDRTDLSEAPTRETARFSVPYKHKSTVWEHLEDAEAEFDHRHGAESPDVPADHIEFAVKDTVEGLTELLGDLIEATSGDVELLDVPEKAARATVLA